jgi:hypothetical protein
LGGSLFFPDAEHGERMAEDSRMSGPAHAVKKVSRTRRRLTGVKPYRSQCWGIAAISQRDSPAFVTANESLIS